MTAKRCLALAGILVASLAQAQAEPPDAKAWHRLVAILQYLESDYPAAIASRSPSELAEQAAFAEEAEQALASLGSPAERFRARLSEIRRKVEHREDPPGVSRACSELVEELVRAGGLSRSPRRPPDLERGRRLYAVNCAACHGTDGSGQVPIASTMKPPPANLLDPERINALSPYKAFNALTFGISGTAMPSYSLLDEKDRWDLAFFLFTLRQPPCGGVPPAASLETLATSTDAQLASVHGPQALACLRRKLPDFDEERSLLAARDRVEEALRLAAKGDSAGAREALVDAYLTGVEPIEPLLRARDARLVVDIEASFARARVDAERARPHLQDEGRALLSLLDRARRSRANAQSFASVLWLTFFILLREGFEAAVVIAALLAVLKKMRAPQQARVVHAGWISAVVIGAVAFLFFRHLLVGARRELAEGVFSLLAVAMLVYAALWLNARSNIRKFMGHLRSRMQGAMGRGSALGLFTIAFTAMLRESVETAVFLEGLAIDSPSGVRWGIAAGAVALFGLVMFIRRVGYRLPMKQLFNASTVLLLVTAVILLGQGLHALQELGVFPLAPIRMVRIDALGIYPDLFSLTPQLLLALAPFVWYRLRRNAHRCSTEALSKAP